MEAKSFLLSALPLKIDTSITREERSSKMSGFSQNTNTPRRMPVIAEGAQREAKLSEALKEQMNANFNRQGYIVNSNQIGKLSKMHVPEVVPDSPLVITNKRKGLI